MALVAVARALLKGIALDHRADPLHAPWAAERDATLHRGFELPSWLSVFRPVMRDRLARLLLSFLVLSPSLLGFGFASFLDFLAW